VEKYCRADPTTDYIMAHAHCILVAKVKNTLSKYVQVTLIAFPT